MRSSAQSSVNILIADYDCTLFIAGPRVDGLSTPIIGIANKYIGFYGCTHRNYANVALKDMGEDGTQIPSFYQRYMSAIASCNPKADPTAVLTSRITENFEQATNLTAMAVSTLDDFCPAAPKDLGRACGYGYENIMKPYDQSIQHLAGASGVKPEAFHTLPAPYFPSEKTVGKNKQLLSIMLHARASFPQDVQVKFDFLDDILSICEQVAQIDLADIPPNTHLNAYHINYLRPLSADMERPIVTVGRNRDYAITSMHEIEKSSITVTPTRSNCCSRISETMRGLINHLTLFSPSNLLAARARPASHEYSDTDETELMLKRT